jgi:putative phosphoesterase
MLVGIISDTHVPKVGEELPTEVLERLRGVDLILHAGDLVSLDVVSRLEEIAPVRAVQGNMDYPEVRGLYPEKEVMTLEGLRLGLTHGSGAPVGIERRVLALFRDMDLDVVVFGHTHKALVDKRGGVLLLNPGSPNDSRFHPHKSLILLHIENGMPRPELIKL